MAMAADHAWQHAYSALQVLAAGAGVVQAQALAGTAADTAMPTSGKGAAVQRPGDQAAAAAAPAACTVVPKPRGGTGGLVDGLVGSLKAAGATEALFLCLLALKEGGGEWQEGLDMFLWMQTVSDPRVRGPAHSINQSQSGLYALPACGLLKPLSS